MDGLRGRAKWAAVVGMGVATPLLLLAQAPSIEHDAVGCIVADRHPRIEARLAPAEGVSRVRVYFRAAGTTAWYFVEMKSDAGLFQAALPKPKKATKAIDYYVEALSRSFGETRTPEYQPVVVAEAGGCDRRVAAALLSAPVALGAAAGSPAVPAGFASAGIASAGGVSAGLVVAAVVVGGGAIAGGVVAASKSGDDAPGGPTGNLSSPSPRVFGVTFAQPGIDVSVCAGRALGWCCQNVNAQADGTFNEVWSPGDPNTMRVIGRVDQSRFDASLTCASGVGPTGSISTTGNGTSFNGTFSFGASQGSISVARQ